MTVRPQRPKGLPLPLTEPITLRLDPVSARRVRLYRRLVWIAPAIALVLLAGIWVLDEKQSVWAWVLVAISVMLSLIYRLYSPAVYPRIDTDDTMVRLDGLDPGAVDEWTGVNRFADISVLPPEDRTRRYFFGTKAMFFAMLGYFFLSAIIVSNYFEGGTRDVSVDKEVFSWSASDREDITSFMEQAGGTMSAQCSGGGRLYLITITPAGQQEQMADVACDGSRHPVAYPSEQPMYGVLGRNLSGTVTDWRVSVTRTVVEKQVLAFHAPEWTVLFPIGLTALLALVPLEALLMVRHWRAIPPQQRPHSIGELPEFRGVSAMKVALCCFGLFFISTMTVMVWLAWAQAT